MRNGQYNFLIERFKTIFVVETDGVPFMPYFVLYVCACACLCPCSSAYNHDNNFCHQSSATLLYIRAVQHGDGASSNGKKAWDQKVGL